MPLAHRPLGELVTALAAKQPTPGGGGAAAVAAAIGAAAARMSAAYTTLKKGVESGAAATAQELITELDAVAVTVISRQLDNLAKQKPLQPFY